MNNYITSRRLGPQPTAANMELPPLPFQFTYPVLHDDNYQFRFVQSQAASTCGTAAPIEHDDHHLLSQFSQDHSVGMDLDAYHIHLQNEKLLAGLKETWKRRSRGLLLAIRQQVTSQMIEKESQLETARRRNAELEDKLSRINAEMHVWFDMAKSSEAIAAALQTKLDHAMISSFVHEGSSACDNRETTELDAQSSCIDGSSAYRADAVVRRRQWSVCRMCQENAARVLLLPCRHLNLCRDCEPLAATCPLCCSVKNASLEINLC